MVSNKDFVFTVQVDNNKMVKTVTYTVDGGSAVSLNVNSAGKYAIEASALAAALAADKDITIDVVAVDGIKITADTGAELYYGEDAGSMKVLDDTTGVTVQKGETVVIWAKADAAVSVKSGDAGLTPDPTGDVGNWAKYVVDTSTATGATVIQVA